MISILQVWSIPKKIRLLNIPKIHTTQPPAPQAAAAFSDFQRRKDTGPKTALFGWPPKGLTGRFWDLILGCGTWLTCSCLWASWQTARYHCGRWGVFFRWGKKRMPCMMRCPKWFFWRPCSWPGKPLPFRCCFSSNEYCIASCFMHPGFHFTKLASQLQASSGHSSKHHLESTISALVFSDTQNTHPTQHSRWGND